MLTTEIFGNCKNESKMKRSIVEPGHPEYVGDDGGEESLEEQAAVLLRC